MNPKLEEISRKLGVTDQDIKDLQDAAVRERIFKNLIIPVLIIALSILTGVAGLYLGSLGRFTNGGYPFGAVFESPIVVKKSRRWLTYVLLIPLTTFIAGFIAGRYLPPQPTLYGVYKRNYTA